MTNILLKPIGYQFLLETFNIKALAHYRRSFLTTQSVYKMSMEDEIEIHHYPKQYAPMENENKIFHNIEFALKYDGINLEILDSVFAKIDTQNLTNYLRQKPTSKYTRKIWFLYEWLTENVLEISNTTGGSFVFLLDERKYFTSSSIRSTRHYVDNNLLGSKDYCPIVRKTLKIRNYIELDLSAQAKKLLTEYNGKIHSRAQYYLFTKETMSSFAIEKLKPNHQRMQSFINLLHDVNKSFMDDLTQELLIKLQNTIVDLRFVDKNYRTYQNYVGEEPELGKLILYYIPPRPQDCTSLMNGLLQCFSSLSKVENLPSPILATIISFGLVFIHPFEDGNGRLHRFLIHYVLSRKKFTPPDSIFPISATILKNINLYDKILERFSRPLSHLIDKYKIHPSGELEVLCDTKQYYKFMDFTSFCEYLYSCIEQTINIDYKQELEFIYKYDLMKNTIQKIVDLPDRKMDLLIRFLNQNNGKLSKKKYEKYFSQLTKIEISKITHALSKFYQQN